MDTQYRAQCTVQDVSVGVAARRTTLVGRRCAEGRCGMWHRCMVCGIGVGMERKSVVQDMGVGRDVLEESSVAEGGV